MTPDRLPLFLHVDMDAFFASVEVRSDPRLKDLPLAVGGGPSGRGVVTTASYAARKFGIRSGMAMTHAMRLCPHLFILPVDPSKYIFESLRVLSVLERSSPRVEAASIDEAYVQMAGVRSDRWNRRGREAAERIQEEVRRRCGLPCSVGVAVNKLQAKMATPLGKPEGVTVLSPGTFLSVFGERPVSVIPGIGEKTTTRLAEMNIHTVRQLSRARPRFLTPVFGRWTGVFRDMARGTDQTRLVTPDHASPPKSAGHETTFARDTASPRVLRAVLWLLADRVARRLRLGNHSATTVAVRYKIGAQRHSRQRKLVSVTRDPRDLALVGWSLLESARKGRALRLLGVAGMGLVFSPPEPRLFPGDAARERVIRITDRIRDRFGENAVRVAETFLARQSDESSYGPES